MTAMSASQAADSPDPAAAGDYSAEQYASHWEKQYRRAAHQAQDYEWHCGYEQICARIRPYLEAVLGGPEEVESERDSRVVVDLGCGSSSLGLSIARDYTVDRLFLTDVCPYVLDCLRAELEADLHESSLDDDSGQACTLARRHPLRNPSCAVSLHTADCRRFTDPDGADGIILPGAATLVLDKGTMDALHCVDHEMMLEQCVRALKCSGGAAPSGGLIVSVSFASVPRLRWLQRACEERGLWLHVHFVNRDAGADDAPEEPPESGIPGDPAHGGDVRLLSVMGRGAEPAYTPSALTRLLLERVEKRNSLLDDDSDDGIQLGWSDEDAQDD